MLIAVLVWQVLLTIAIVCAIVELRGVGKRLQGLLYSPTGGQDPPTTFSPIGLTDTPGPEHHWVAPVPPKDIGRQGKSYRDQSEKERAEYDTGLMLSNGEYINDPLFRE